MSGRRSNASDDAVPRIITLGGDHTTTLSALRSTFNHWGAVSVIHFDSHLGNRFIKSNKIAQIHDTNRAQILGTLKFLVVASHTTREHSQFGFEEEHC